jgi:hypothetical protein
MNIMNIYEMKSEELPMGPEIFAREQNKETHLKEVMKYQKSFQRDL